MNDKAMQIFEIQLKELINNSKLTVGEAYYVLKVAFLELEQLYNKLLNQPEHNKTYTETIELAEENTDSSNSTE